MNFASRDPFTERFIQTRRLEFFPLIIAGSSRDFSCSLIVELVLTTDFRTHFETINEIKTKSIDLNSRALKENAGILLKLFIKMVSPFRKRRV